EYRALNKKGKRIGGIVTAEGPAAARRKLSQDLIFPTEITEITAHGRKSLGEGFLSRFMGIRRIHPAEVTTALRQFATLVSSGLPIVECLNGLIEQTEQTQLKKIFIQIRERVLEGESLSTAMKEHPTVFNTIYVNLIRAGETSGALDAVLRRLADFSERRLKLKKKIESAMAYPLLLLLVSSIILIFLMSFVMPKVIGIFQGMGLVLPWSTRTLIWMTESIKQFWWLIVLFITGTFIAVKLWIKTESGGRVWDRIWLALPVLGRLHQKSIIARFSRTLSVLLKSGIPLVDSLEIARLSMGNRIMQEAVKNAAKLVGEGEAFSTPLRKTGRFPPLFLQLIRAGEQSGELEDMFAKGADFYENDVETTVGGLMSVVEILVILFMAVIVFFLVIAILLPIFDMTKGISIT
ncbi:MAG: type II secretion system F family protein, partial [Deltaproteobacteria bacterium]|nr:type II secretion system F family protein [Deltaproteobacteria bacterium]